MRKLFLLIPFLLVFIALTGCQRSPNQAMTTPPPSSTPVETYTPVPLTPTATLSVVPTQPPSAPETSSPTLNPTATETPPASDTPAPTVTASLPPTDTATPSTTEAVPTATEIAPETPTATPSQEVASGCENIAAFYDDVTIPDGTFIRQGESFTKVWRIRNLGTCDWDDTYQLSFAGGEFMNSPPTIPLTPIRAGEIGDISIDLTAPNRGGEYTGYWHFQDPTGQTFGVGASRAGLIWVQINIGFINPETPTTGGGTTPSGCAGQRDTGFENQILNLINNYRSANGLAPLTIQEQLNQAAYEHSRDMACQNFVSHTGSDGSNWYIRAAAQGYANNASCRENIYAGNPAFGGTASGAFDWWINSPVHRDNILYPDVSQIGIGYVFNSQADYGGYLTALFGRP